LTDRAPITRFRKAPFFPIERPFFAANGQRRAGARPATQALLAMLVQSFNIRERTLHFASGLTRKDFDDLNAPGKSARELC